MQECDGLGNCLRQTIDQNTYEKCQDFPCKYDCKPIPCPNEIICDSWCPKWLLGIKITGLCMGCNSMFAKTLTVVESAECPMCLETTKCVIQPNCSHPTCVKCFKRCMYGEPDYPAPEFPYSNEIEDEMYEIQDRDIGDGSTVSEILSFLATYPLIHKWELDCDEWERKRDLKYYKEQNLRVCPLCRK